MATVRWNNFPSVAKGLNVRLEATGTRLPLNQDCETVDKNFTENNLGMGRYQICVHQGVARAKLYQFWDSAF